MTYALLGVALAQLAAIVFVIGKLVDVLVDRELEHQKVVDRLLVRIQAPDSPQVTMAEPHSGPRRKLKRSEDDEIAEALNRSAELLDANGVEVAS